MSAVKLRDFFDTHSRIHLSSERKSQIFQSIKSHTIDNLAGSSRNQTSALLRYRRYFKSATGVVTAFVLMYLLYVPFPSYNPDTSINIETSRTGSQVVQAGYIGKLLDTQGEIQVVRQGIATNTNNLYDGDIVFLYNTSKTDFILKDGSLGKIEGPAKITIIKQGLSGIMLSVDHARYMQIDKAESTSPQPGNNDILDIVSDGDLVIETPTSRITTRKNSAVHLALITTQERQFIKNNGAQVTIESRGDNVGEVKQLASSHVAEVTDAVKVYNQVALIYEELKSNSLRGDYSIDVTQAFSGDMKSLLTLDIPSQASQINVTDLVLISGDVVQGSGNNSGDIINQEEVVRSTVSLIALDINSLADQNNTDNPTELFGEDNATTSDILVASTFSSDSELLNSKDTGIDQDDINTVNSILNSEKKSADVVDLAKTSMNNSGGNVVSTALLLKPLTQDQISLLINTNQGCITMTEFQLIQQSFDINNSLTIQQTILKISKDYHLTRGLQSILNALLLCNDEKNPTN